MQKQLWDSANLPLRSTLEQVLYRLRGHDGADGLLFDAVRMADILEDSDGVLALDALVIPLARLEQRMQLLQKTLDRASKGVKVAGMQVSDPFTQRGSTNVAVIYELTDGQTVSVFFHNPDVTPKKIGPGDDIISWKWMLNKKDITVAVAPERGRDLDVRTVAARIMQLADKNSARFIAANGKRAEKMEVIASLKTELDTKKATLADLESQIAAAQAAREAEGLGDPIEPLPPMPEPEPAADLTSDPAPDPAPEPEPEPESQPEPAALTDEDKQKLADKRDTLMDLLADNPDRAGADEMRAELERINGIIGAPAKKAAPAKAERVMAAEGDAEYMQALYDLDYTRATATAEQRLSGAFVGQMKRDIRAVAKRVPQTDEKAVFYVDKLVNAVFGADYDPKVADIQFAPEPAPAVEPDPTAAVEPAPVVEAEPLPEVAPQAAAESDPRAGAIAKLQSVIDGTADLGDAGLSSELMGIHAAHKDDADMLALFKQAVKAYSAYAVSKANAALAK